MASAFRHNVPVRRPVVQSLGAVLLVLGAVLLGGCGRATASPADGVTGMTIIPIAEREPMPAIAGPTIDGGRASLDEARGKIVVVNAWASWCPPCQEEVPLLVASAAASDRSKVAFYGLDVNDDAAAAAEFAGTAGIPYPSIVDADGSMIAAIPGLGRTGLPSTVILDRQGRVAARIIGPVHEGDVESVVATLEAEA